MTSKREKTILKKKSLSLEIRFTNFYLQIIYYNTITIITI